MSVFGLVAVLLAVLWGLDRARRSRQGTPELSALRDIIGDLQGQLESTRAELDSSREELDQQKQQVAELAERMDFAERRLIQAHERQMLPPSVGE